MVADLVLRTPLPEAVRRSVSAYVGCIAGAWLRDDYLAAITAAGFEAVRVLEESSYAVASSNPDESELALLEARDLSPGEIRAALDAVVSIKVSARKPGVAE